LDLLQQLIDEIKQQGGLHGCGHMDVYIYIQNQYLLIIRFINLTSCTNKQLCCYWLFES